jgi:hypothetical protein
MTDTFGEGLILKVDFPRFAYRLEVDGLSQQSLLIAARFLIFDRVEGQLVSLEGLAGCFREILCQPLVVERRFALASSRIDENEILPAVAQFVSIPEALGAGQPMRLHLRPKHLAAGDAADFVETFVVRLGSLCLKHRGR